MNWADPAERAALIERVGPAHYNELHAAHQLATIACVVNGHPLRRVATSFGTLFTVGSTGRAYPRMEEAESYAKSIPAQAQPAYVCPYCGAQSWNPNDGRHRFCGRCKQYGPKPLTAADEEVVEAALNLAIRHIQDKLGVTTGDHAGQFFDGYPGDTVRAVFDAYLQSERSMASTMPIGM